MANAMPRTLFDKVWDQHVVTIAEDDSTLLAIDRHFLHEGSHHAFAALKNRGNPVARPDLTFAVADHYVPTRRSAGQPVDPVIRTMIERLEANTRQHGIALIGMDDPRQGIVHVVGPEQGLTLPGLTIVCGDSHTSTHGAYGALAFGIGASEVAHVLATGTLWQRKPKSFRITVDGPLGPGIGAKDIALHIIATIGADGASGYALEYAGSTIRDLSIEGRLTLCNLSIESGARCGMIAPDETTFRALKGRPFAPEGAMLDRAIDEWTMLSSDEGVHFDRDIHINSRDIAPIVTWGITPEHALPISARIPDAADQADETRAQAYTAALDYMGLTPGTALDAIPINRIFIGSCTNARIEDLRMAAAVLAGRTARVPGLVSPGSSSVKRQAEEEGLDSIFINAGLEWVESGCSMCVGMNGDLGNPGERIASTTNRNFRGRQGSGVRTHLMSPAMAAAAAVTGTLTDCRPFLEGRLP